MTKINFTQLKIQQDKLRHKLILKDSFRKIKLIGGCDVCYRVQENTTWVKASIVVLTFPNLRLVDQVVIETETNFPYVPGFLSFREIPTLKKCFNELKKKPDLLLVDGEGIAHFRKMGLASHLGIELNMPTIGCTKEKMVGNHKPLKFKRGNFTPLYLKDEVVGRVLCTRDKVKPIYVSVGHKISLSTAAKIVLQCSPKYRIPEPLRLALEAVSCTELTMSIALIKK